MRHTVLILTSAFLLISALTTCQSSAPAPRAGETGSRGRLLYSQHCAVCHGEDGRASGRAAPHLFPPARDFGRGHFRLVSTANGMPLEKDIVRTLKRGMPGSSMPSWNWMAEEDLSAVAAHVLELSREGLARSFYSSAFDEGDEITGEEARAWALERLRPGPRLEAAAFAPPDREVLERGRMSYESHCANCHGRTGQGKPEPRWNEDGGVEWARDITAGFLKGGLSQEELTWRLRIGLPGTTMPALEPSDARELPALIAYVRSLIPAGTAERLVHRRGRIVAARVSGEVPEDPADPRWIDAEEIDVTLAPLWWRDASVLGAQLSAMHDGDSIAIRLRWPDSSRDARVFSDLQETDGAALQISAAETPPLFGMGSRRSPTALWHWESLRLEEIAGWEDLSEPTPHLTPVTRIGSVRLDSPVYERLQGSPALSRSVETSVARGVLEGRVRTDTEGVQVLPRATDTGWELVFVRSLGHEGGITFTPGQPLQVACAVWNGAAGDRSAQKSISIWQLLELEP